LGSDCSQFHVRISFFDGNAKEKVLQNINP
jgi:hypothetical protein